MHCVVCAVKLATTHLWCRRSRPVPMQMLGMMGKRRRTPRPIKQKMRGDRRRSQVRVVGVCAHAWYGNRRGAVLSSGRAAPRGLKELRACGRLDGKVPRHKLGMAKEPVDRMTFALRARRKG